MVKLNTCQETLLKVVADAVGSSRNKRVGIRQGELKTAQELERLGFLTTHSTKGSFGPYHEALLTPTGWTYILALANEPLKTTK